MGAVLAILGESGDPELGERMRRMLTRSPHRGNPEFLVEGPLAIGVQSLGLDASLAGVGNWLVAFHGFIGNWAELTAERSWRFEDDVSNAGKIGVAFEELGNRLFAKLRGEWALLVWDRREQRLLAARDVVGCRPLFVHWHGGRLYLATEIRQVMAGSGVEARCNPGAAADYHLVRFPEGGHTVFEGVRRLPGGVARSFHAPVEDPWTGDVELWKPLTVERKSTDHRELVEEVRGLIDNAVKRAAPKTGAAVSLSGGMDSSSVWGTLVSHVQAEGLHPSAFKPYSNIYPGLACDETPYIRSILEFTGVDGELVDTSTVLASDYLETLCDRIDHPHLPNALPVELICAAAAADSHSVLLTGLGGDEWLGGSLDYIRELFYSGRMITALHDLWSVRLPTRLGGFRRKITWLSPQMGLAKRLGFRRTANGAGPSMLSAEHRGGNTTIRGSWRERVAGRGLLNSKERLVRCLDRLAAASVVEIIEQQAAWHGIEIRHPLMDLDVVEFGFAVEPRALIAGRCHKWLLRRAMVGRLPAEITERIETTEFNRLFTREEGLLQRLPPGREWHLTRLGVTDAAAIDSRLTAEYSQNATFEMIRLGWLESFIRGNFPDGSLGELR